MKQLLSAFVSGALFALGLGVAGMTLPSKVTGFLDIAGASGGGADAVSGAWDPSLAFVMIGAIGTHIVLLRLILRRGGPLLGGAFQIPTRKDLDAKLVVGAALFGIGWGLGGYCPGPALTSLVTLAPAALVVVIAMAVGIAAATPLVRERLMDDRRRAVPPSA